MSVVGLGLLVGLHITVSLLLGLLAHFWKRHQYWQWVVTGLLTSIFGFYLLICAKRLANADVVIQLDMQMQYMDDTPLLQ